MKITDIEGRLLAAVALQGDASVEVIAKQLGVRRHIVRRALGALFERGLLGRRVVVNVFQLGYSIFGIWCKLPSALRRSRAKVIAALKQMPQIGYVGEFQGEFELRIDVYVRSNEELFSFFEEISRKLGAKMTDLLLSSSISITDFPVRTWSPHSVNQGLGFRVGATGKIVEIDEKDTEILRALGAISTESHTSIAKRLRMPLSSLDYRINRLRESGVVVGYLIFPRFDEGTELGGPSSVYRVVLSNCTRSVVEKVHKFIAREPSVYSVTICTGSLDFEFATVSTSVAAERKFLHQFEEAFSEVISSVVVVRKITDHKVSNFR